MAFVGLNVFPFSNVSAIIDHVSSGRYWRRRWTANYLSLWVSFMFLVHVMYTPCSMLTNCNIGAKHTKWQLSTLAAADATARLHQYLLSFAWRTKDKDKNCIVSAIKCQVCCIKI